VGQATSTILGMGRHKVMAWLSLAEMASTVVLAAALVGRCELSRPGHLLRRPRGRVPGGCQAVYVCRLVRLPLRTYVARAWLPALLIAAPPPWLWPWASAGTQPDTWPQLFAYGATFTAGSLLSAAVGPPRARPGSQVDPVPPSSASSAPGPEVAPEPASLLVEDKPRTLDPQAS